MRQATGEAQPHQLKLARSLQQRKYREREGAFLLEGLRLVEEALLAGWRLRFVLHTAGLAETENGPRVLGRLAARGIPCYLVTEKAMSSLAETVNPQGILAVAEMDARDWRQVLAGARLVLVADGIQDPGNLGTMIRTAAGAGFDAMLATAGSVDLYNGKTLRSTMGACFRIPLAQGVLAADLLPALRGAGLKVVVADAAAPLPYHAADLNGPLALVVGNENGGPAGCWKEAGTTVSIPLARGVESLNAAVAAGILVYEVRRQQELRGG